MSEQIVSLVNMGDGAAIELFDDELSRVIANILDPNTSPEAVREVTLVVKIEPDEETRERAVVSIQVKSKLGPMRAVGTRFFLGKKSGRYIAVENNPRQVNLFDQPLKPVTVDIKRGEVQE